MPATPIRCTARHPDDPQRECRAWLLNAVPDSVDVHQNGDPPPGCVQVRCPRCGARYVVCRRDAAA